MEDDTKNNNLISKENLFELDSANKNTDSDDEKNQNPFLYVAIGASAGGLEALEQFFNNMPINSNLTFIVVQHLSPDYKSLMVELLSRQTDMEVFRAEEGLQLAPNCVYLIPPKKNITIKQGKLHLTEQGINRGLNLPIDIFFRSLAKDQKNNSIGIILSGTGSDGTLGVKAIKEVGGMIMVQDDRSAKFDGMPKSAIATGLVDYVLPPNKMPEELIKYIKHPYINKNQKNQDSEVDLISQNFLARILAIVRTRVGVDFSQYKPNTILRRLERRFSINQVENPEDYIQLLQQSPYEVKILYKEILIGVTQFFRDPAAWDLLKEKVVPKIFETKQNNSTIRIWSAACSTGEEAYSLAILLREYMDENDIYFDVKVFASDLDKDALEFAGTGIYPESIASDVTEQRLKKYFIKNKEEGYQIIEQIRRMVIFAKHNLVKDPPFSKIDMVVCRNLLIYLKPEMQNKVLSIFHFALNKNGFMFLGSSENLGSLSEVFSVIDSKSKVYKYKKDGQAPLINDLVLPAFNSMRKHTKSEIGSKNHENNDTDFLGNISEQLLNEFMPPSILIDSKNNILHFFKDVDRFIHFTYGRATFNVLKLVRHEFSMILSGIIHKAKKEKKDIIYKDVHYKEDDKIRSLDIGVKYLLDKKNKEQYFLISFIELTKEISQKNEVNEVEMNHQLAERINDLEQQLQHRDENLQTTVEELETSNEELQATNEELIASNEELQSTNEELQSVNEELYTVNSEFQKKIQELTSLNNDINNLLNNTKIGTLYLDRNLAIRKYTSFITKIFYIKDIDIGRPISDFSFNANYDYFFDDIKIALTELRPKEVEIQDKRKQWHLMRIFTYFTNENKVNGVIVTVIDITARIQAEEALREIENQYGQLTNNLPDTDIYLFDTNMKFLVVRGTQMKNMGMSSQYFEGHNLRNILDNKTREQIEPAYIKALAGEQGYAEFQYNDQHFIVKTKPLKDKKDTIIGGVALAQNITKQKAKKEKQRKEYQFMLQLLNTDECGYLILDKNFEITFLNDKIKEIFEIQSDDNFNNEQFNKKIKIFTLDDTELKKSNVPFSKVLTEYVEIKDYECQISINNNKIKAKANFTPWMFDENIEGMMIKICFK